MTTKSDFSASEWQLLLDVPPAVGTAVMVAGQSGIGSVKEAMALANGILGARNGYDGIELVESLVNARIREGEKSSIETLNSPYAGSTPEDVLEDTIDKCQRVVKLLTDKATADKSAAYKDWSLDVGVQVAESAKEGGFLGIGGERVSEEERSALRAISNALQLAKGAK